MTPAGDPYLVERIRTALAEDARVGELGIAVEVEGESVILSGDVASDERRVAVAAVVTEVAPGYRVDDRLATSVLAAPIEPEAVS